MLPLKPTIYLIAHGDHNFSKINCTKQLTHWKGHMDNQLGVYTVMQAYFSGQLPLDTVNIQITYGQQKSRQDSKGNWVSFLGARQVMQQIKQDDLVIVIDVTSMPPQYQHCDFTIQKCKNKEVQMFMHASFAGKYKYEIFDDTPDTQACEDETDAFREITQNVVFFGMMVSGGNYNLGEVFCNFESQKNSVRALIDLCKHFEKEWGKIIEGRPKSPLKLANQKYYDMFEKLKKLILIKEDPFNTSKESIQSKWISTSRKFTYSEEKRYVDLLKTQIPSDLKILLDLVLQNELVSQTIKGFDQPTEATVIVHINSPETLKKIETLDSDIFQNTISEKYIFVDPTTSDPSTCFILLAQKRIFKLGIIISA